MHLRCGNLLQLIAENMPMVDSFTMRTLDGLITLSTLITLG